MTVSESFKDIDKEFKDILYKIQKGDFENIDIDTLQSLKCLQGQKY